MKDAALLGVLTLAMVTTFAAAPAAAAEGTTYTCTVDVGAQVNTPVGSAGPAITTDQANIGGCSLATVENEVKATDVSPADGCEISADVDGDGVAQVSVEEGQTYPADTSFSAFCSVGVVDATNSLTLDTTTA